MKHITHPFSRLLALVLAVCLLPVFALADTYLPEGDVTHVDFTLGVDLHADGFPASEAHLSDWEAFLKKLELRGSMNALAFLTPTSRVYMDGALQLNGKDAISFTYDGYHSYRYFISPALNNEVMHFQMHNFYEFMLKPYYYMELPTQYLALLLYPEGAYYIGDSYYTPVAEMLANAKEAALNDAAEMEADEEEAAEEADNATSGDGAAANQSAAPEAAVAAPVASPAAEATVEPTAEPTATPTAAPTATPEPDDGSLRYTVPYESLYELCETLDLLVNDDVDYERVYFFFTCLLTEIYASDMTVDALAALEDWLDYLDPEQNGMTVVETENSLRCAIGETEVFAKTTEGDATAFTLTLPNADGYVLSFDYRWTPGEQGAALDTTLSVMQGEEQAILLSAKGENLPQTGSLGGQGKLTLNMGGYTFTNQPAPIDLAFDWSRTAAETPYTLNVNVDWLHPATQQAAVSLHFSGAFSKADQSVFVEAAYPQNDFFNLNEGFMEEYKQRLLPTLMLKALPIVLETPSGVINDIINFCQANDILLALGIE